MIKYISFIHNKELYKVGILFNQPTNNLYINNDNLNKNINNIYNKCFDSYTSIESLLVFTSTTGFTILIIDNKEQIIFITSIIFNNKTKNIEIYNVCKHLEYKSISSTEILYNFIWHFIKPIFYPKYKRILLSILINNKFIIPTVLCYINLGFKLLLEPIDMIGITMDRPHFKMYLNLDNYKKHNKYKKIVIFKDIIVNYFWNTKEINKIHKKLIGTICKSNNKYNIMINIINYLDNNIE